MAMALACAAVEMAAAPIQPAAVSLGRAGARQRARRNAQDQRKYASDRNVFQAHR
jgi:hypothetical protein